MKNVNDLRNIKYIRFLVSIFSKDYGNINFRSQYLLYLKVTYTITLKSIIN
jgi:hypothetical protein